MNKENQKQVILAAVLAVVAVGVILYQFVLAGDPTPPPPPASTATAGKTARPAPAARGQQARAAGADARLQTVEVDADQLLQGIQQVQFDYARARVERNPMAPLVGRVNLARTASAAAAQATTTMRDVILKRVTGIVWDSFSPAAVVDDEVVSVGHTYDNGVRVYAIEPSRVIFLVGDSLVPVELKELGL